MSITFLGDVFLDKKYKIDFDIDKCIFNLEFAITDATEPAKGKVNLKTKKSFISETFGNKVEAVSLANNHIFDFKEQGYHDTIANLEKENINYFGAGKESNNFNNPHILTVEDNNIGMIAYNCETTHPAQEKNFNVANLEVDNIIKDIKNLKKRVDFLVLYIHWGIEEIPFPKFEDTIIAHKFIEAGVDLIIGQHPHVMQGYEIYKDKYIFYSLGNFIFPDLNKNSNFNGKNFSQKYIKKQEKEHRRSIVVSIDNNLKVDFFTVSLENDCVQKKKCTIPTFIPKSENEFKKKLKNQRKINMVKKFIRNPKLPNIGHLTRFFKGK